MLGLRPLEQLLSVTLGLRCTPGIGHPPTLGPGEGDCLNVMSPCLMKPRLSTRLGLTEVVSDSVLWPC